MTHYYHGPSVGSSVQTSEVDDNAITLAKMAHGTDGNLITYDAAGAPANVATGTSTHVLTSNGVGAAPTFQAAAAGGGGQLELIEHHSASGNIQFATISGYKYLYVTFNLLCGTAGDVNINFNNDTGANYEIVRVSSSAVGGATAQSAIQLAEGRTDYPIAGSFLVGVESKGNKCTLGCYSGNQSTRWQLMSAAWNKGSSGDITEIDITGTSLTGVCTLYGVKET